MKTEPSHPLRFRKPERLRLRSLVEAVFREGDSLYAYPLRLSFLPQDAAELDGRFRNGAPRGIDTLQVMVTVPKRKLRHAVDRVLMRRRIREAYRLHRLALKERLEADPQLRTLSISIIYIADRTLPYPKVEKALLTLLRKLGAALGHEAPDE